MRRLRGCGRSVPRRTAALGISVGTRRVFLPDPRSCPRARDIRPRSPAGTTTGVLGMAGPTGKSRWRCETGGITDHSSLLATGDPQGLPRIWTGSGNMQTCFEALAVDDRGRCLPPQPAPLNTTFAPQPPPAPPAALESSRRHAILPRSWSGWWIVVAIDVIAIASIVGRRPGKLHRAVWLFGLWLVPWLLVEIVRYVFAAREMGPRSVSTGAVGATFPSARYTDSCCLCC